MANNNFVVKNGLTIPNGNITLGAGSISVDVATGAVVIVPSPTATYPNPQAIIITAAGTIATTSTTGGVTTIASVDLAANNSANSGTNISSGPGYAYELDSFTCNGVDNLYPLTFNGIATTVAMPWNLTVTLAGLRQSGFMSNAEPVFQSLALPARPGYTIDTTTVSYSTTATGALAGNTIVVASVSNIQTGMLVTGNGIPAITTVTDANVSSSTVTLSSTLIQSLTSSPINFAITNIKFANPPAAGTICLVEGVPGTQYPLLKKYPFKPLDIMLGY